MNKSLKVIKEIGSWIIVLLISLLLATLINSQLFSMATVKEISMQNTLFENQRLVINRLSYKFKTPQTGDIIVFYKNREIGSFANEFVRSLKNLITFKDSEEETRDRLVKRVIAIPGDIIDIVDGAVFLNNKLIEEPYVKGITMEDGFELPVTVKENQLFVMGDNREYSMDSRDFGLIELSHVEGKAIFRLYPLDKLGKLN